MERTPLIPTGSVSSLKGFIDVEVSMSRMPDKFRWVKQYHYACKWLCVYVHACMWCVCVCVSVCVCVCVCVCLGGDRGGRVSDNFWLPTSTTNWDLACLQSSRTLMQSWISPKWPFDRFFYVFSLFRDVVYKFQPHKFSQNFLWFQSSKILKHS